jgi:hypothetical protein
MTYDKDPEGEVIAVSEEPPAAAAPDTPAEPDADLSRGNVRTAGGMRFANTVVSRLADQARQTANAAKARRVVNGGGEPGALDLTPLGELLSELVAELGKLRPRDRIARALRRAADVIDSQTPDD